MVVFLLAAAVAYVTWGFVAARRTTWDSRPWWKHRWELTIVLLLLLLLPTLSALLTGAWQLYYFRQFALAPETGQAILGIIGGIMCRIFPRWAATNGLREPHSKKADTQTDYAKWPLLTFAVGFAGLVLLALIGPNVPMVLDRTSSVETPYVKIQFLTSPGERQRALQFERDLQPILDLDEFPRSARFIQYDCMQAAIEAHGIGQFKLLKNSSPNSYQTFTDALRFHRWLGAYVNRILNAQRQGDDIETLKGRVRIVAAKFVVLVSGVPADIDTNAAEVWKEIEKQNQFFELHHRSAAFLAEEKNRQLLDPDPPWCDAPYADIDQNAFQQVVKELIETTGFVHRDVSTLLHFAGDIDSEILVMSLARAVPGQLEDINVNDHLAATLYLGGRDFTELMPFLEIGRQRIDKNDAALQTPRYDGDPLYEGDDTDKGDDDEIIKLLRKRYERARFDTALERAYLWAQEGVSPSSDLLPEEVHFTEADQIANEAYKTLRNNKLPRFRCTDDSWELSVMDTYAYVKLAFQTHNLKNHRIQPIQTEVTEAREVLEDASARVRDALRLLIQYKKAMMGGAAPPTCLTEAAMRAWAKRISGHVTLAEALLR
jgi:hypothetical protein